MLIHITNKLQKKLHVPLATAFPVSDDDGCQRWYANVFRANRMQYILTTHAASLYSVVLPGRGITDETGYLRALWPALEQQLTLDGLQQVYEQHIAPHTESVAFVKTSDRSILGSMNDMVQLLTNRLECDDPNTPLLQLGADLNKVPFKAIGYRYAQDVFIGLFTNKETKQ